MGLTLQEANDALKLMRFEAHANGNTISQQDLKNLISQLDVGSPGETTLLYGSSMGDGTPAHALVQEILANDDSIRALDKTEASKFLDWKRNSALKDALDKVFPGSNPNTHGSAANQYYLSGFNGADYLSGDAGNDVLSGGPAIHSVLQQPY